MILTQCAVCATELGLSLGKKCGRCSTRYCGPECQKKHWEEGGHDKLCKLIKKSGGAEQYNANNKYAEAVTIAAEACAEDTKGQTCYICTQAHHWKTKEGLVREARRPAARAPAHEALLCFPVEGLRADVARLALRVLGAFRDRDRDGLLVFFVGVVLFRVAAAVYFLTHLLVAAAPVVMLASGPTISCVTPYASRRVVGQWGGAGGAICEDHYALAGRL